MRWDRTAGRRVPIFAEEARSRDGRDPSKGAPIQIVADFCADPDATTQNARFLSELTKFSLVPSHSILHAFKVCVDDLVGHNVDVLCHLMEGCGRWLLRTEATRDKMSQLVRPLSGKKKGGTEAEV